MKIESQKALNIWRVALVEVVRNERPDLTSRQMAVLLTVYLAAGPHTVRGLAATLNVSKPAITRALDRLGELDLVRRKADDADRRSILVQRTVKGSVFLSEFGEVIRQAALEVDGEGGEPALGADVGPAVGLAASQGEPDRLAAG